MNAANNLTTWITFGGSYPGSLSGWMRLRFPHLVAGSVSSSGPLFAKLDYYEYLQVTKYDYMTLNTSRSLKQGEIYPFLH